MRFKYFVRGLNHSPNDLVTSQLFKTNYHEDIILRSYGENPCDCAFQIRNRA